ncbi:ATP synthase F1 subunit gamma [Candidatus Gracilibacteria bacterium]|jgi:F-type H+-transporting ATPase subunit gamma|nr:ATP synthase F1 subunit gamma [Candidatus Gracilibacteria bacterium]
MSGSLLEIRKKIGGVKNTRKITKAMQLVAASKMRQFQKKAMSVREYTHDLLKVMVENKFDQQVLSKYMTKREAGPTLFVLYTSDKGLCGGLNVKLTKALINSKLWQETPADDRLLITIGRKSHDFAKSNKIPVALSFNGVPERISNFEMLNIVDKILDFWRKELCKEIHFIAPHYKNSFTFYPVRKVYLPFSVSMLAQHLGSQEELLSELTKTETEAEAELENYRLKRDLMLYNPNKERVVERLHEQIVENLFMQSFMELKAAEYSSRMIAMQNATDAADRMIKELSLTYNKARQAAITREIAELSGAMSAI